MSKKQKAQGQKLSKFSVVSYGLGGFASTLITVFISSYAVFFMTDYAGISAGLAGVLMTLITFWDAINDPIIGTMADQNQSKWGKYRPYLLVGGILMTVMTTLRFVTPSFGKAGTVIYFFIVMAAWSAMFTAFTVPWQALNAIIVTDVKQRNLLLTSRQFLGFIAAALASAATVPIVNAFGGGQKGYFGTSIIFGVLSIICVVLTERGVRKVDAPGAIPTPPKVKVKEQLGLIVKNKAVIFAALVFGMHTISFGIITVTNMYYFTHVMHNENLMTITGLLGMFGTLFAVLTCGKLIGVFGKKTVMVIGLVIMCIRPIAIMIFGNSLSATVVIVLTIVSTAGNAIANYSVLSMIPDCIDYTQWRFGSANPGFINASVTFMQKFAGAFASLIPGILLDAAGYGKGEINEQVVNAILLNVGWVPFICAVLAGVLLIFYPLNTKEHKRIQEELQKGEVYSEK